MNHIDQAANALRKGELVIFPTETVYGLGANALSAAAVRQVYSVKGRPASSPLIIHCPDLSAVRRWCGEWPESAQRLAEKFWPGPLTLVLPKKADIVDEATSGLGTVGVRVPSHPVALEFLRKAGVPVAAPSANPFTRLSPTRVEHVREVFGARVRWILDGGPSAVGIESTVISLVGPRPRLLRPGMVSLRQLEEVIGPIDLQMLAQEEPHASPGLHKAHYQPRTPVVLYQRGKEMPARGRGISLLLTNSVPGESRLMPNDPMEYARELYAVLHELDVKKFDWIAIELPPETAEWEGILDRLTKAAAPNRTDHDVR